jgi:hypothetical protein
MNTAKDALVQGVAGAMALVVLTITRLAPAPHAGPSSMNYVRGAHFPQPGQEVSPNARVLFGLSGFEPDRIAPQMFTSITGLASASAESLLPELALEDGTRLESNWTRAGERDVYERSGPTLPSGATIIVSDTWGLECQARATDFNQLTCDGIEVPCCGIAAGERRELFRFATSTDLDTAPPATPIPTASCRYEEPVGFASIPESDVVRIDWERRDVDMMPNLVHRGVWWRLGSETVSAERRMLNNVFEQGDFTTFVESTSPLSTMATRIAVSLQAFDWAGNAGPLVVRYYAVKSCSGDNAILTETPPDVSVGLAGTGGAPTTSFIAQDNASCAVASGPSSRGLTWVLLAALGFVRSRQRGARRWKGRT